MDEEYYRKIIMLLPNEKSLRTKVNHNLFYETAMFTKDCVKTAVVCPRLCPMKFDP